jgi:hypothetical protein
LKKENKNKFYRKKNRKKYEDTAGEQPSKMVILSHR